MFITLGVPSFPHKNCTFWCLVQVAGQSLIPGPCIRTRCMYPHMTWSIEQLRCEGLGLHRCLRWAWQMGACCHNDRRLHQRADGSGWSVARFAPPSVRLPRHAGCLALALQLAAWHQPQGLLSSYSEEWWKQSWHSKNNEPAKIVFQTCHIISLAVPNVSGDCFVLITKFF